MLEADILHVQGSMFGALSRVGRPVVTTVHTTAMSEFRFERSVRFVLGRLAEALTLSNSDSVIAVSNDLADEVRGLVPHTPVFMIPNCVDPDAFYDPVEEEREPVILAGGRHVARKDFVTFLKALATIRCRAKAIVFGDGPLREYLENLSGRLGLRDVTFVGYLERTQLLRLYSSSSIFVSTSLYETGPITVMEAMMSGLPVISSSIRSVERLVIHGKTGLLFPVGNHKELATEIDLLLTDSELRTCLGDNARENLLRNFNPTTVGKQTLKVYDRTMSGM